MTHRAKKSLGQHFLRSASAVRAMVSAGSVSAKDIVLEIGPGEGVLTHALLQTGAKVIAVEFDRELIPLLEEKFSNEIQSKHLTLVYGDVLDFDPKNYKLKAGRYKLVANIPYYITGAIFEKFLTEKNYPNTMVVLIQKEVASRIVARDKKESILSLSIKAFGNPKLVLKVPASAFRPAPKVDSAILSITSISQNNFGSDREAETFFKVVHAGFAHKRKFLIRNLEAIAQKERIQQAFHTLHITAQARAEDITLSDWISLSKEL